MNTIAVRTAVAGYTARLAADAPKTRNHQSRRSTGGSTNDLRSAPVGIRTPNLLIRSQMLYPLSYGRPSRAPANLGQRPREHTGRHLTREIRRVDSRKTSAWLDTLPHLKTSA